MTHHLHKLFCCALICLIIQALSSCSVQKRRYRHGFYISTHGKTQQSESAIKHKAGNAVTTKKTDEPLIAANNAAARSIITVDVEKKRPAIQSVVLPLAQYVYQRIEILPQPAPTENKKLRPERIGFITALASLLLSILTIFLTGLRFAEYGSAVLLIVCVVLTLVALYNCAKVFVDDAGQEQKRKGYWMAVAGLVICTLCFLFWANVMLNGHVFR